MPNEYQDNADFIMQDAEIAGDAGWNIATNAGKIFLKSGIKIESAVPKYLGTPGKVAIAFIDFLRGKNEGFKQSFISTGARVAAGELVGEVGGVVLGATLGTLAAVEAPALLIATIGLAGFVGVAILANMAGDAADQEVDKNFEKNKKDEKILEAASLMRIEESTTIQQTEAIGSLTRDAFAEFQQTREEIEGAMERYYNGSPFWRKIGRQNRTRQVNPQKLFRGGVPEPDRGAMNSKLYLRQTQMEPLQGPIQEEINRQIKLKQPVQSTGGGGGGNWLQRAFNFAKDTVLNLFVEQVQGLLGYEGGSPSGTSSCWGEISRSVSNRTSNSF